MSYLEGQRQSVPHLAIDILACLQLPLAQASAAHPLYHRKKGIRRERMVMSSPPTGNIFNQMGVQRHTMVVILNEMDERRHIAHAIRRQSIPSRHDHEHIPPHL